MVSVQQWASGELGSIPSSAISLLLGVNQGHVSLPVSLSLCETGTMLPYLRGSETQLVNICKVLGQGFYSPV